MQCQPVAGTNGVLRADIQCYRCQQYGHFGNVCPNGYGNREYQFTQVFLSFYARNKSFLSPTLIFPFLCAARPRRGGAMSRHAVATTPNPDSRAHLDPHLQPDLHSGRYQHRRKTQLQSLTFKPSSGPNGNRGTSKQQP